MQIDIPTVLALLSGCVAVGAVLVSVRAYRRQAVLRLNLDTVTRQSAEQGRLLQHALKSVAAVAARSKTSNPNFHSQQGEDAIAWSLLGFPDTGFYIEVGAYDGVDLSNTHFLEQLGWTGLLVEAHPGLFEKCKQSRPGSRVVHAALGADNGPATCDFQIATGPGGVDSLSFSLAPDDHVQRILREGGQLKTVSVPCTSLNKLLGEMGAPQVDVFSLDVEGAEMLVLQGFDFSRWSPKVMIVEDNTDGRDATVRKHLEAAGYTRVLRLNFNEFYMRTK